MIGRSLAHYEVTELLGEGGMGQVYRARDTKLGRDVALKVLPGDFGDDPERVARFRREARTLASLQHANIAAIHGIDEADGQLFLTMELVEGEDLSRRLARGPLPLEDAIEIALGVAQGLEAAHAKGVVHRDLKPANVKLAADGTPKILDFGLARAIAGESVEESDIGTSPTITAAMTQAGTILGTASYMAPEQARGRTVDHRADIWAFGVLLWEMLRGRRLFHGETTSDVLANVLKQHIDPEDLPKGTPPNVRRVLARCLQRDPKQRLHAIADARIELGLEETNPLAPPAATGSYVPWVLTALLAVAVVVAMWRPWATGDEPAVDDTLSVAVNMPEGFPLSLLDWQSIAVTPDGTHVGVTARINDSDGIVVRSMRDRDIRMMLGDGRAYNVFFSPDSRWIGYTTRNHFVKSSIDGGPAIEIVPTAHPRGASWGDRGHIYFVPGYTSGIHRVLDTGNAVPETLTVIDTANSERTHRWPHVLPDERGVVFTIGATTSPGDYEDAALWVLDLETGERRDLGIRGAMAKYSPTGHLLIARVGSLHAVPFDLRSLEVDGTPVPVHEGVRSDPASGMYYFDLDANGNLYTVAANARGPQRRLKWIDRDGTVTPIALEAGLYRYPRLDAARNRALLVLGEGHGNNDDVYVLDFEETTLTRLTFDQSSIMPQWMPDFRSIAYTSVAAGALMVRELGSSASVRQLDIDDTIVILNHPGADARTMLATQLDANSPGDLVTIDLETGDVNPLISGPAVEWAGWFSPDMKWFTYCTDETGREEIFVQPYPPTGARWQVSDDGGRMPRWSDDGTEIFFVQENTMWAAAIRTQPDVRVQTPVALFEHRMDDSGVPIANYDVTPDGRRFLVVENDRSTETRSVEVVLGWARTLAAKIED